MALFESNKRINNRLEIEDRGSSRISKIARVAVSKSTGQQVMELAWTAGPVTLVAALGGYYIGHGKIMPKETVIFLVAYTVIAGVIGLAVHFTNRLGRERQQQVAADQLVQVVGTLPSLIIDLRDLHLKSLEGSERKLEAARILLQDVDLGPRWLSTAVLEMGGDHRLAEAAATMDTFFRAGMSCRAKEIYDDHKALFQDLAESVRIQSPQLAESLEKRLSGERSDPRSGIPRDPYFIERILAAIDDEDDTLMTLGDVEEIYTLLFELLSGRRIPVLTVHFVGRAKLARQMDMLEKKRFHFRMVRARSYSRLLALATYLSENMAGASLASRSGLTGQQLLDFCHEHIESLMEMINSSHPQKASYIPIFRQALILYHQAYITNRKTDRVYTEFAEAVSLWKQGLSKGDNIELAFDSSGKGRGLQIIENSIYLSDREKLKVVRKLVSHLGERFESDSDSHAGIRQAKEFAVRVVLALDETIHIRRPDIQRAIYNANSINMGVFQWGLSSTAKIGLGESLSKEIRKDMRNASRALVAAIYRFYGVKLGLESTRQLSERYGASVDELEAAYQDHGGAMDVHTHVPVRPFSVPRAPLNWRLAIRS